jgi:uncharacterized protein (DUF305 family)
MMGSGHGMAGMMAGTPRAGMTGAFDLMFIDMMIPHHQGAIMMAQVALTRGEHQEVRDLAQAVITAQQAEIDQLRTWRDGWYPNAPAMPMDQMAQAMGHMMQGMPGMMATPGMGMENMGGMMGMMDPAHDTEALCSAAGPFDQAFIDMMIPHHQSAVLMAEVALQRASHPEIKHLAETIIAEQEREITQMQGWLAAWYGGTPAAEARAAQQVDVTLTEFTVTSSIRTFQVGQTYRFVVTNAGAIPHEFMIMPEMDGIGEMTMDALDDMALVMIPADDLPPGAMQTIEITFPGSSGTGEFELVCAVPGHYNAGMALPITVAA